MINLWLLIYGCPILCIKGALAIFSGRILILIKRSLGYQNVVVRRINEMVIITRNFFRKYISVLPGQQKNGCNNELGSRINEVVVWQGSTVCKNFDPCGENSHLNL